MGSAQRLHVLQVVDWSKYDLQEWLRQFGCWLGVHRDTATNQTMVAIKKAKLRLGEVERGEMLAQYICNEDNHDRPKRNRALCLITDDEARAVQKLVLDVINGTDSQIMLDWMQAIIDRYFTGLSWPNMITSDRGLMDARMDVKCGLAALHSRYAFIKYEKDSKDEKLLDPVQANC